MNTQALSHCASHIAPHASHLTAPQQSSWQEAAGPRQALGGGGTQALSPCAWSGGCPSGPSLLNLVQSQCGLFKGAFHALSEAPPLWSQGAQGAGVAPDLDVGPWVSGSHTSHGNGSGPTPLFHGTHQARFCGALDRWC